MKKHLQQLVKSRMDRRRILGQKALTYFNEAKRLNPDRGIWDINREVAKKFGVSPSCASELIRRAEGRIALPPCFASRGILFNGQRLLTLKEAASRLHLASKTSIRDWIEFGLEAPKHTIVAVDGQPNPFIAESDLDEWLSRATPYMDASGHMRYFDSDKKLITNRKKSPELDEPRSDVPVDEPAELDAARSDGPTDEPAIEEQPKKKPARRRRQRHVSKKALLQELCDLLEGSRSSVSVGWYHSKSKYGRAFRRHYRGGTAFNDFLADAHRLSQRERAVVEDRQEQRRRPWWKFWARA